MNNPSATVKHLVFDLGNVLVDVNYRRFTDVMGWANEDFLRFYDTAFFREFETGKQNEAACFREMANYVPLEPGDIPRYRENIYRTFPLRHQTLALLPELRKSYGIFLFSNTNSLDFNGISQHIDFDSLFDGIYTSHRQGFLKPQPEAYRRVETLFGLRPEHILYFDDRIENIEGGIRAGWQTVHVRDEDTLLPVLRRLI
jgi:HAD superfamily hydrolase (TIGR01509 family)